MKYLMIILLLQLSLFAEARQLLDANKTKYLVEAAEGDAIILGHGKKKIYAFIDPYCPVSQAYIKSLYKSEKRMFPKYSTYLFLFELPRKHSADMISTIYTSKNPQQMIKSIMVNGEKLPEIPVKETDEKVKRIYKLAKKIGVHKRPYIVINGKAY